VSQNLGVSNKVRSLQYLIPRSFYAKLLAVKRVTSNKGKKTPGVDGVLWQGARAKWRAVYSLRRRGYKPQPLRRKHRFAVRSRTASGKTMVYEVIKLHAIGIRTYIKIKADANPYLQEYARYFWRRRNEKGSKLLAAMSAREIRAVNAV